MPEDQTDTVDQQVQRDLEEIREREQDFVDAGKWNVGVSAHAKQLQAQGGLNRALVAAIAHLAQRVRELESNRDVP